MKLSLSGLADSLKIGNDGKKILTIIPDKENLDLMAILPFHRHECDLRILGTRADFRTRGYIDEVNLKNKLKLKFVCLETVDLNMLNNIIDDPETTSIVFDDRQSSLQDFDIERKKALEANKKATAIMQAEIHKLGK